LGQKLKVGNSRDSFKNTLSLFYGKNPFLETVPGVTYFEFYRKEYVYVR
jgi:hypothetical protein